MKHIFKGQGAPTFAPRQVGHHYVDVLNGHQYLSKGIASPLDWVLINSFNLILKQELITLTNTNIVSKQFNLSEVPYPGSMVQLIPVGGPTQVLSIDYDTRELS